MNRTLAAMAAAAAAVAGVALARPAPARVVASAYAGLSMAISAAVGHTSWEALRYDAVTRACAWCGREFAYRGPGAVVCSGPCGDGLARLQLAEPDRAGDPAFVAAWREVLDVEQAARRMAGG